MQRLFSTTDSYAPLIARLALGAVILPHGLQKTFGLFGGYGFEGTMGFLTSSVGLPWLVALVVVFAESVGALSLIFGFLGRLDALLITSVMVGAVATMHWGNGFFMNWTGGQAGEGFEYHILAVGLAAIVLLKGSGPVSVDAWIASRFDRDEVVAEPEIRKAA